jgi:integrase
MAVKSRQNATSIIRYAIQRGYREEGLFIDLKGVLKPIKESHFPSPTEENNLSQVSKIMKSVLLYKKKNIVVGSALNLLLYTFARPIELVCMRWEEIIEKGTEWHYLVSKNDNQKHIVPLSKQAQNILKELKPITGDKEFVFSSTYAKAGHIHRDKHSATWGFVT